MTESTDYCDVCGLPMSLTAVPPEDAPLSNGRRPGAGPGRGPGPGGPQGPPSPPPEKSCPNCRAVVPASDLFCENCGYDFTTGQLPVEPAAMVTPGSLLPGAPAGYDPYRPSGPSPFPGPPGMPGPAGPRPAGPGSAGPGPGPGLPAPAPSGPPAAFGPSGPAVQPPPAHPAPAHTPPGRGPGSKAGPVTWVAEIWVDPDWFATQDSEDVCPSSGMPMIVPLRDKSLLIGRTSSSRNIHPQIDCGSDHGVSRRHAQLTSDGQRWWVEDLESSNGTFVGVAGVPLPRLPIPVGSRTEFAPGDRIYVGAWTRIVVRKPTADET